MRSRLATAIVGLVASLALSAAIYYATGWFVFFVAIPFLPLLFRGLRDRDAAETGDGPAMRACPECDFRTTDPDVRYCPRDGTALD
ncbi:hypothetical protein [Halarchaeum nitratireducens]|uniref:Uncharacterized protein n=1 Tax=Halarchaeum nitratireducens TaxID=489913 RepID=A0A830GB12_9EURY|nr:MULTISPECIES: hypothetical protein [Halarchaeum]MBP2250618.1 hypothetical protein [Halarchaeum solikamskense]GGN15703.1 hypothetical protein GCM10009021_15120 [Halarchaeum nitratireducens]